jgi:hypothetical protein
VSTLRRGRTRNDRFLLRLRAGEKVERAHAIRSPSGGVQPPHRFQASSVIRERRQDTLVLREWKGGLRLQVTRVFLERTMTDRIKRRAQSLSSEAPRQDNQHDNPCAYDYFLARIAKATRHLVWRDSKCTVVSSTRPYRLWQPRQTHRRPGRTAVWKCAPQITPFGRENIGHLQPPAP